MATTTDTEPIGEDHALPGTGPTHGEHPTEAKYWKIFFILFAVTAVEVLLYYVPAPGGVHVNNGVLLILAGAKFIVVAGYFMHLKFDSRILRRLFITGFVLAVAVYVAYLLTMGVFIEPPPARH